MSALIPLSFSLAMSLLTNPGVAPVEPGPPLAPAQANPDWPSFESPPDPTPAVTCGKAACIPEGLPPEPIGLYLATGEYERNETDLTVAGVGLDVVWTRKYRSRSDLDGPLGVGWDFAYNVSYTQDAGGLLIRDGNSRVDRYAEQNGGLFTSPELAREASFLPDGRLQVLHSNGTRWILRAESDAAAGGKLDRIVDRNENQIVCEYDGAGRLTGLVDTLNRKFKIGYGAAGLIETVSDFTGRVVQYGYTQGADSLWDLTSVSSPVVLGTPLGNDFPQGRTTTYDYTTGTGQTALDHNLVRITSHEGRVEVENIYTTETNPANLDHDRVARQLIGGGVLDVVYEGEQGSGPSATRLVLVNDPMGFVDEYVFDANNRCLEYRELTGAANPTQPTTSASNRPGSPLRASDPAAFVQTWDWNDRAQATRIGYPAGNLLERDYLGEVDPSAGHMAAFNRLEERHLQGTHPVAGNLTASVERWTYLSGAGGCCGSQLVASFTDGAGFVTTYDYDAAGNRITQIAADGLAVTNWSYDARGRVISVRQPEDGSGQRRQDTYTYDRATGAVASEVIDAGGLALTTTYEADALGRVVREIGPAGADTLTTWNALDEIVRSESAELFDAQATPYRVVSDTLFDGDGKAIQLFTDHRDQDGAWLVPARLQERRVYDTHGKLASASVLRDASHWIVEELEHDAYGRRTLHRKGSAVDGSQPDNVEVQEFDERGRLFKSITAPGLPSQDVVQYDYDLNGNTARVQRGWGATTRVRHTIWDGLDRPYQDIGATGTVTTYTYNGNNDLLSSEVTGENQNPFDDGQDSGFSLSLVLGGSAWEYGPFGVSRVICYNFDSLNVDIGDGEVTKQFDHAPNGALLTLTTDSGATTEYRYDTAGRQISEVDGDGNEVLLTLDAAGNVLARTETLVRTDDGTTVTGVTEFEYDALGRMIMEHSPAGYATMFGFSSVGQQLVSIPATGGARQSVFDGAGREIARLDGAIDEGSQAPGSFAGLNGGRASTFVYDDSHRLIALIDDSGNATRFAYDASDRPVVMRQPDGGLLQVGFGAFWPAGAAAPLMTNFIYGYDPLGEVYGAVDASLSIVLNTRDPRGLILQREIIPGPGVSQATTLELYAYDGLGRLIAAADNDSWFLRTFDSLGHLESDNQLGLESRMVPGPHGMSAGLIHPSGRVVTHGRDAGGRLRTVSLDGQVVTTYEYEGPQRVRARLHGNGTWIRDEYGADGQLSRVINASGPESNPTVFFERLLNWSPTQDKLASTDPNDPTQSQTFTYNTLGEVESATGPVPSTVSYDAMGNRTSSAQSGSPSNYGIDPAGSASGDFEMNRYSDVDGVSFSYDTVGRLVRKLGPGVDWTYTYDYRGQLVAAHDAIAQRTHSYRFDALGRRIEAADSVRGVTRFLYADQQVVEERDAAGTVQRAFVYGNFIDEPLLMDTPFGQLYYHVDDMFSVVGLSDSTGLLLEQYQYGLYGELLSGSVLGNPYFFTGRRLDGTGLYHSRYRAYDPQLGRFLQIDPWGAWFDPLAGGGGYIYGGNSPTRLFDPLGFQAQTPSQRRAQLQSDANALSAGITLFAALTSLTPLGPFIGVSAAVHIAAIQAAVAADLADDPEYCIVRVMAVKEGDTWIEKPLPGNIVGKQYCYPCVIGGKKSKNCKHNAIFEMPYGDTRPEVKPTRFQTVNAKCDQDCNHPAIRIVKR